MALAPPGSRGKLGPSASENPATKEMTLFSGKTFGGFRAI